VRGHAARSLGRLGAAQAADRLLPLLNDRYAFVRTEAMMALASLRDARALDATVKAVQDPDPGVRRQAVAALGLLGGERAAAELAGRLGDRDPVLRANAVAALIRTGPAAVRPVAALMAGPEHAGAWEFLTPAGEVLAALGPPAVSNCAALMNHPRWEVQVTAAAALARMNPPGLDALIEALRHGNAFRAAQALGGVADPRATDALLEALRNPNVGVVAEAVRALARQHAARGVESVIPLLDHPDGHVKEAAREALEQLTRQYLGPAPAPWKRWWEANKKTLLAEPQEGQR
jgi:HEAT repeat protein